jgi:ribosome-interacting GTPase 1
MPENIIRIYIKEKEKEKEKEKTIIYSPRTLKQIERVISEENFMKFQFPWII